MSLLKSGWVSLRYRGIVSVLSDIHRSNSKVPHHAEFLDFLLKHLEVLLHDIGIVKSDIHLNQFLALVYQVFVLEVQLVNHTWDKLSQIAVLLL